MGIKLVIVDDAPFIREAIRNILSKGDIEVIGEADNGLAAVVMAKRLQPDVILMDLVLPGQNGIDAAKEIFESLPNTRIIACSTLEEKKIILDALEAGCSAFIQKPFEPKELIDKIMSVGVN